MRPVLEETINQLLLSVAENVKKNGVVSTESMSSLHCVFGDTLLSAFNLIDQSSITQCVASSGRHLFKVAGSAGRSYCCPSTLHFCPCRSFTFGVLTRGDLIMCKHLLAIHLEKALNKLISTTVTDEEYELMLYEQ